MGILETNYLIGFLNPGSQNLHSPALNTFHQVLDFESPGVDTRATGLNLNALVDQCPEHHLHVALSVLWVIFCVF